ncbi:MAG: cupin domain-containing protein [Oscillospiraceae bacterium]|nr:cupin domain-containing protein [Oscillospiraceae bacterium]
MQELIISNVKSAEFATANLNEFFEPAKAHKRSFEYQKSAVANPFTTGAGKLCVCFYTLQPGKANYPYHYHLGSEEVFYIISGSGTLKTPDGEKIVSEGDVIVMPANQNGAHMLINTSNAPLVYLDVDTVDLSAPEAAVYPDSGKIMTWKHGKNEIRKVFKLSDEVNYLEGE